MWTLVTMCSMKLTFIPLGLNYGYFPSWLCQFFLLSLLLFRLFTFTILCSQAGFLLAHETPRSQRWCDLVFKSALHQCDPSSCCGPAVNLSCLWHLACVNVSLEVLWSWKRKSVSLQECHHTVSHRCQVITSLVFHCIRTCEIRTQCPWWHHKVLIPKMCLFCFLQNWAVRKKSKKKVAFLIRLLTE